MRIWLVGFLAQLALCVSFPFDPASARVSEQEEIIEPDDPPSIAAVRVAGPFAFPWSIAFLPDDSILVTERPGRLQLIRPGLDAWEVTGVPPVVFNGQVGLLDVAVDPAFSENRIVYVSYAHGSEKSLVIRVLTARLDPSSKALADQRVIFESTPAVSTERLGGRIAVTADGYLFLTVGDGWRLQRAQDLSDHAGKIIRIRTDGSVPGDNPFVSVAGARPEIWSYGHRNPQGLAFHVGTGQLWSHEHGPVGGDELNLIVSGRNYGWPVITYGTSYSGGAVGEGTAKEGMEQPIRYWTPAIAPSGLAVESAGEVTVFWIGALVGQSLVRLEMEDGRIVREQRLLKDVLGRIRDVRIGPDGHLYLTTDSPEGALYRVEHAVEQASRREDKNPR